MHWIILNDVLVFLHRLECRVKMVQFATMITTIRAVIIIRLEVALAPLPAIDKTSGTSIGPDRYRRQIERF
jgi:hypothetical protein